MSQAIATVPKHRARMRHRPPGPSPWTEIPRSPAGDKRFFEKIVTARQEWGDVVRVGIPPCDRYLIYHPDDVKHVLLDNHANYGKDCLEYRSLRMALGDGLVTSDGELWRRQRKLAAPAFTPARVAEFGHIMTSAASDLLDDWAPHARTREPFELTADMMATALRIVGDALFGFDTAGDARALGPAIGTILRHVVDRAMPLPLWIPLPRRRGFKRGMATLNDLVDRIVEARRSEPGEDLLSWLIRARDAQTGEAMSDRQLRDEIITLLVAGHETTATNLTWTFYLLSKSPEVRVRLFEEVDSVLGDRVPVPEDLAALPFTRQVIQESLRLYPPVWGFARVARGRDAVGGYPVRPGRVIFLVPYATHRHPDFWPNPEGFDPDRFAPENARRQHRFAWFPFAGGGRICIGNNFAMLESQLLLAMACQRYELDLVPGRPVAPQALITARPREGMWMTARERH